MGRICGHSRFLRASLTSASGNHHLVSSGGELLIEVGLHPDEILCLPCPTQFLSPLAFFGILRVHPPFPLQILKNCDNATGDPPWPSEYEERFRSGVFRAVRGKSRAGSRGGGEPFLFQVVGAFFEHYLRELEVVFSSY